MKPSKNSRELAAAISEDNRRQAIDAAKKRAVAQQADYDTFKKLVSVAHLKPLTAPSGKQAGVPLPAWQLDSTGALQAAAALGNVTQLVSQSQSTAHSTTQAHTQPHRQTLVINQHMLPNGVGAASTDKQPQPEHQCVPGSSHLFTLQWRRHCPTAGDKYRLLKLCGAEHVASLFKVEIDGDLLSQLLVVLQQEFLPAVCGNTTNVMICRGNAPVESAPPAQLEEAHFIVQLLYELTGVGRFDLSSRLVSKNARQAAAELCSNIAAVLQDPQHHSRQAAGSLKHGSQQQAAGTDMLAEPGALAAISCPAAAELQQQHQHDNEWIGKLMHIQSKLHVPE